MVGIAGAASDGGKEDDEDLGDLVVGRDVYYYERGKVTVAGKSPEPITYRADATLLSNFMNLPPLRSRIPVLRPDGKQNLPRVITAAIASGEKVIADGAVRDEIVSHHRKTRAIEMEGYGFSAAAWQSFEQRRYLVMKAICDRADRNKGEDWQPYAAAVAAQYARHFLRDGPLDPRNKMTEGAEKRGQDSVEEAILPKLEEKETDRRRTGEQLKRIRAMIDELASQHETGEFQPRDSSFGSQFDDTPLQGLTPNSPASGAGSGDVGSSIGGLLTALSAATAALSQEKGREIERIRELHRAGQGREALRLIRSMCDDQAWKLLDPTVQSRALRVMAAMTLNVEGDRESARRLAVEARVLDPQGDDVIIRTLLRWHDEGLTQALAEIGEPSGIDAYNLKLSLLIHGDRANEALQHIRDFPDRLQPDAETGRLKALALLAVGEVTKARTEIQRVMEAGHRWVSMRVLAAIIEYFDCLSSAAAPTGVIIWPQPVNPAFVKRDDESQGRLRELEKEFTRFAADIQRGEEERRLFETWRLACLANTTGREGEAEEFCKALLLTDASHYRALMWAVACGFEVELETSERAITSIVDADDDRDDPLRLERVIALVCVRLTLRRTLEAATLLAREKGLFDSHDLSSKWAFWYGQTFVIHGEPEKALEEAERESDPVTRRQIRFLALRETGRRTGDWRPLLDHLRKSFEETGEAESLFELCQLGFSLKEWEIVVEQGRELIELIGTADAARLAAFAAWNAQQPKRCLRFLGESTGAFPGRRLPNDLRRLQSLCEAKAGLLSQAVKTAATLAADDPATENVITLMDVQRMTGDLKGLTITARTLLERDDVQAWSFLRAARLVFLEQMGLARDLWRRAKNDVLDDPDLAVEALLLGYALGLDAQGAELDLLSERVREFAAKGLGPARAWPMEQLFSWMQERERQRHRIAESYYKGEAPIHMFARENSLQLAELLHGVPEQNRSNVNPRAQLALFTRHGGRPLLDTLARDSSDWRLHLDLTSLLVAADLGVLDKIENLFAPIRVSTLAPTALIAQRANLRPSQPAQRALDEAVLLLLEKGSLREFVEDPTRESGPDFEGRGDPKRLSYLLRARAEDGLVVDDFPTLSLDFDQRHVELPEELAGYVIDGHAVVETLRAIGGLSEADYERALDSLGARRAGPDIRTEFIPQGAKLFLLGGAAISLGKARVLNAACERFAIFVDADHIKAARADVEAGKWRSQVESWVEELAERLRAGLADGRYEGIDVSETPLRVDEGKDEQDESRHPDLAAAAHLLQYEPRKGDVLCFDDRAINGYPTRDHTVPIIGIGEILLALRLRGELSEREYYDKVMRLRAGNHRYVPLSGEEILYHLDRAWLEHRSSIQAA